MLEYEPIVQRTSSAVALWAVVAVLASGLLAGTEQAVAAAAGGALAWTNWRVVAFLLRWASSDPERRGGLALVGFHVKGLVFVAAAAWLGIGLELPAAGLLAGLSAFAGGALWGALRSVGSMRGRQVAEG